MNAKRAKNKRNEQSPQIFLLDGYALAYRAFYAMIDRPLRTSWGQNTSVPMGITRVLRKLLVEYEPEYLVVIFDAGESFRHELYEPYKLTRQKLDETNADEFSTSMEWFRAILDAMHIPTLEVEGFEADDVIGTLAHQAANTGMEATIVSSDTDFYQLIGPGITVIEPGRRGRTFIEPQRVDAKGAAERFGVPPERVIDYLALVGDATDNVPGVRGIGPKTAISLLEEYHTLENVLKHLDDLKPLRARKAIAEHRDDALLSKQLVTIRTDAPVRMQLDRFQVREPDWERLREIFVQLEFYSLLHEFSPEKAEAGTFRLVTTPDAVRELAQSLETHERIGLDVLIDGTPPRNTRLVGIALALAANDVCYVPLAAAADQDGEAGLQTADLSSLAAALDSPTLTKVGHDLKTAMLALRSAGLQLGGSLVDTLIASYCLNPARRQYDLETQALERYARRLPSASDLIKAHGSFAQSDREQVASYATQRAALVLELTDDLQKELKTSNQQSLFEEIEMPLVPVLAEMEWAGVAVDQPILEQLDTFVQAELKRLTIQIYQLAGEEFNLDSPTQLRQMLFERLGLPVIKRTKTGPSTDADVLSELAARGHELPARLLEYRELNKLKTTYLDALRAQISPETRRLHTSFNQTATATGRLSSSDPNLQNIPVRTPLGATIRRAFVPQRGSQLLVADYSQIELRILAHLSHDELFVEAFRQGEDIHRGTAAGIFNVSLSEVTSDMRELAKTVNYATLYGQGSRALARQLTITVEEAESFIEAYFTRFHRIREYLDEQIRAAEEKGYVETIFGRRRYVPELRSGQRGIRGFGERVAQNAPIQGSAADLIKRAMIGIHRRLHEEGFKAQMLLQVHDELVLEVPKKELETVRELVRHEMEQAAQLAVPLVVDIGTGPSWYAAKGLRAAAEGDLPVER